MSIDSPFTQCSAVDVADGDGAPEVSFTCFRAAGRVLMGRLFSSSVVRRSGTHLPLTTFSEDEEVMRESGISPVYGPELIV